MLHREAKTELHSTSVSDSVEANASASRRAYSWPDVLLLLYVTCIAREYLWFLNGGWTKNTIAWSLSTVIGLAIVHFLADRRDYSKPARWQMDWLWLAIVCLPLLSFFLLRAPFRFWSLTI